MGYQQNQRLLRRLAAAALFFTLCALLLALWPAAAPQQETKALPVTDIPVGQLQAVVLKNASGAISLLNLPGGVLVDGSGEAYEQDKLITLIYTLAHLTAEGTVAPAADDRYGFGQPLAQASLLLEETTLRLTLGRACPAGGGYYLKTDQGEEVYRIPDQTAALLLQGVEDLRDLRLYPPLSSENLNLLQAVSIEREGQLIELRQLKTDTASTFFGMVQPVVSVLDWEKVYRKLLSGLFALSPQRFVSQDQPLARYGLDQPEYVLSLLLDGEPCRCLFSRKDAGSWYCTREGSGLVSEADEEMVSFLQLDYMDLIGSSVYSRSVADLSSLSARYDGRQVVVEIFGSGPALGGAVEGRQMDSAGLLGFYEAIDSIPAAARLTGEETPAAEPLLVLSFTMRSEEVDILEFYPISDRQCAVYLNGRAELSTYTTAVQQIIAEFERLR